MTNEQYEFVETLIKYWGERTAIEITLAAHDNYMELDVERFLDNCIACGGNWGGMLLTGIKALWPEVWELIPDNMGIHAFECIVSVLNLCGVDTRE